MQVVAISRLVPFDSMAFPYMESRYSTYTARRTGKTSFIKISQRSESFASVIPMDFLDQN